MLSTTYLDDIKPKVSKGTGKHVALKAATNELSKYHTSTMLWFLAKRHKFGIVVTILIVYVAFNTFGTLIVGLIESIK